MLFEQDDYVEYNFMFFSLAYQVLPRFKDMIKFARLVKHFLFIANTNSFVLSCGEALC